jgi:predicted transcriptional regulator
MRLKEIAALLDCEVCEPVERDIDLEFVVASDGMSEILAFHCPGALMLTGLTNIQSVRTAIVADVHAIIYVRGKRPTEKLLELAREEDIPVLRTERGMFDCCGILYAAGLRGAM